MNTPETPTTPGNRSEMSIEGLETERSLYDAKIDELDIEITTLAEQHANDGTPESLAMLDSAIAEAESMFKQRLGLIREIAERKGKQHKLDL